MRHITLCAIAALALVPLAISLSPSAPEKALVSKEALQKTATHVVLGEVQRVYEVNEKQRGWKVTRRVAEIRVEGVEKAPAGAQGSLEGSLVYARWFSRRSTRLIPLPDASGHDGRAPKPGHRVRVYLARNAYDGFVSARENDDGGYNVLVPNGFEKLERKKASRRAGPGEGIDRRYSANPGTRRAREGIMPHMRSVLLLVWLLLGSMGLEHGALAQRKRARPAMQKQIDRAIERGVEALLAAKSGAHEWGASGSGIDGSPTALAVYTLLQSGVDRDSPAIKGAIKKIRRAPHARTYGIACAIMALGAHSAREHEGKIQKLADQLVRTQRKGTWGYPVGDDLSNTQFAILGLWAATRAGAEVPDEVWLRAAEALPLYANELGGFSYHRGGSGPTGSMTAAGLGSLAICRSMLARVRGGSPVSDDLARRLEVVEAQGVEWLADHFSGRGNPPHGAGWVAYYLYGTERVGALLGMSSFGTHDWYTEGALYFLAGQNDDGSWAGSGGDPVTTCFALLFLRRATTTLVQTPVSGPTSSRDDRDLERLHARDLGRNRSQAAQPRVEASSSVRDHGSKLGCDGRLDTWWEARPADDVPRLTIEFQRPREVDTILITHPRTPDPALALALEVQVRVNGEQTFDLPMPADAATKGRLELPVALKITSLEVTVTRSAPVTGDDRRVGLGEVEIQMRP